MSRSYTMLSQGPQRRGVVCAAALLTLGICGGPYKAAGSPRRICGLPAVMAPVRFGTLRQVACDGLAHNEAVAKGLGQADHVVGAVAVLKGAGYIAGCVETFDY